MRRRILIVLLCLGTVGGYAAGIASLAHPRPCARSGEPLPAPPPACPPALAAPGDTPPSPPR
jgi:hypothetical protein